jgi:hypothetical protein
MNSVDEIIAELQAKGAALGVWLFGPGGVISGAVKDPSIKAPMDFKIKGVTYFDFGERQIWAEPIGQTNTTLVLLFDNRPSLGFIRLRLRHAEKAIKEALYRGVDG